MVACNKILCTLDENEYIDDDATHFPAECVAVCCSVLLAAHALHTLEPRAHSTRKYSPTGRDLFLSRSYVGRREAVSASIQRICIHV